MCQVFRILTMGSLLWVVAKIKVPFWIPKYSRCRMIMETQKGTIILTTTHMAVNMLMLCSAFPFEGPT